LTGHEKTTTQPWLAGLQAKLRGIYRPQQFLNFLPLPQGQGSLRPTFGPVRTGLGLGLFTSSAAWLTMSLGLAWPGCGGAAKAEGAGG